MLIFADKTDLFNFGLLSKRIPLKDAAFLVVAIGLSVNTIATLLFLVQPVFNANSYALEAIQIRNNPLIRIWAALLLAYASAYMLIPLAIIVQSSLPILLFLVLSIIGFVTEIVFPIIFCFWMLLQHLREIPATLSGSLCFLFVVFGPCINLYLLRVTFRLHGHFKRQEKMIKQKMAECGTTAEAHSQ